MSALGRLARVTYRAARAERAVRDPGRYARNRVKAKALGKLGFWGAWRRLWR